MTSHKDTFQQLDNLLSKRNQAWLLGAGVSVESNIPLMLPLTERVLSKELVISQGDEASAIWSEMIYMEEGEEKQKIIHALKEYCKLDTLAMVEIHQVLQAF